MKCEGCGKPIKSTREEGEEIVCEVCEAYIIEGELESYYASFNGVDNE